MNIQNQIYYHIHKNIFAPDNWKIGNKIVFCKDYYNFFFDYYIKINIQKSDTTLDKDAKIKEYATLIRELVYEEVRSNHFPNLPSRRHCIWLCDEGTMNLWRNTLEGDCSVYKVKVTGNIHSCYAGALDDDNINYQILFEKACAYWRGECIGNPLEKEYLLEGEVEILERM